MDLDQIKQRIDVIDKLQEEIKVAKNMLKDALDNDAAYTEAAEEAKVAASKKKQLRDEVYNLPEHAKAVQEIKDTSEEVSTLKEILSEELIEYRQQHHTESIKANDGQMRYFKLSVKLGKRQSDLDQQQEN